MVEVRSEAKEVKGGRKRGVNVCVRVGGSRVMVRMPQSVSVRTSTLRWLSPSKHIFRSGIHEFRTSRARFAR